MLKYFFFKKYFIYVVKEKQKRGDENLEGKVRGKEKKEEKKFGKKGRKEGRKAKLAEILILFRGNMGFRYLFYVVFKK